MRRSALAPWLLWLLPLLASTATALERPPLEPVLVSDIDHVLVPREPEGESGFELTRFRLGLKTDPSTWFHALATVDFARPQRPAIIDAFAGVTPHPSFRLRLGYAKTLLFPSARDVAIEILPVPELSVPTRALWPGRDVGMELAWAPGFLPLEGWLRVGNGSNNPLGDADGRPSVEARADVVLGRARRGVVSDVGLRLGAAAHLGYAEDRLGIGGTTASGYVFYPAPPVHGRRFVAEVHGRLELGRLTVLLEAGTATERRSLDLDGLAVTPRTPLPDVRSHGLMAEANLVLAGQRRRDGQLFPEPPPESAPEGPQWGWADTTLEVSLRIERLSLGRHASDLTPGGTTGAEAAVRWWATQFLGVSAALYGYRFDEPPPATPGHTETWLGLLRTTVLFR